MSLQSRRDFFKNSGAGIAAGSLFISGTSCTEKKHIYQPDGFKRLNLGMASYTLRKFALDDALTMTNRLGLKHIAFKDFHLSLDSSVDEIQAAAAKTRDAGLDLYGCGVVYMQNEQEIDRVFSYAQAAGMKMIIGVPEHALLDQVEGKVKETGIILAIHNHGPGDQRYSAPADAYERIKNRDPRMGLCLDIGHVQRIGLDPAAQAELYFDRLFDVHIKDVSDSTAEGTTVEIGRGVIDIPKFLATLLRLGYKGNVSLEYEKDEDDPLPGSAESIGYIKGVLAVI
ncbi:MAG TPA: sugar phosphate isomerase/epimerase [bacterium]|nr:sugar phosphate isomerase/epimerase [bacterium]HPN42979.1 sugar phosphate isomerase/epimerase [bacterium]